MLACEGQSDQYLIVRVAYELNIKEEDYIRLFLTHPEWPSPKAVLERFKKEKKKHENG